MRFCCFATYTYNVNALKHSFISNLILGKVTGTQSLTIINEQHRSLCTHGRVTVFICPKIIHNIFDWLSFSPQPPTRRLVCPLPPVSGGRGTLAGEKGVGRVPIPTRGIHCGTLYMYVLCVMYSTRQCYLVLPCCILSENQSKNKHYLHVEDN
jgi:hypothetical protein